MESSSCAIYHCVFDGRRCRVFTALRRRTGLYFAVGCVVDKHDKNFHNCSRYDIERAGKQDTHHCPFDGDLCKHVRGCQDAFFFSNEMSMPKYCPRASIRMMWRENFD